MNRPVAYAHASYVDFIKAYIEASKASDRKITASSLAEATRVQKSYFSGVLNGRANLSPDQAFLLCEALGLPKAEARYLELLVEIERTALAARRADLESERDALRSAHFSSGSRVKGATPAASPEALARYYAHPHCPVMHMFVTVEAYRNDPDSIRRRLGLSRDRFEEGLMVLEECGIVRRAGNALSPVVSDLHMGPSALQTVGHATNARMRAIREKQEGTDEGGYFFTSSFSCDEPTRRRIKARWLDLLESIAGDVAAAPSSDVYQLNLDLFRY